MTIAFPKTTDITNLRTPQGSSLSPRLIARRKNLPNARAMIGGALVVASILGVYAVASRPSTASGTAVVIVASDIKIGEPLTARNLRVEMIDLPEATRSRTYSSIETLNEKSIATQQLRAGDLVQRSSVTSRNENANSVQLSIPIDAAWSLAGAIKTGQFVDVYATPERGANTTTEVVARNAQVVSFDQSNAKSIGGSQVAVLLVDNEKTAVAVIDAARSGKATLVLTPQDSLKP